MTFSVIVVSSEDRFSAALVGEPKVCGLGATRAAAIAALKTEVGQRIQRGELITLDIDSGGIAGLAGKYAADPTLEDICREAYRERDAEISP